MAVWDVQHLHSRHHKSGFDCGIPSLNEWLIKRASQFDRKGLARTFVATVPDDQRVLGYYALANHRVIHEALPEVEAKGLPRLDVPVALLARLAVDRTVQKQGLGTFLLIDALRRVQSIAEHIGIRAVEVDAVDDVARAFYLKFGFQSLLDDERHLFLSMKVVEQLKLPPL